MPALLARLQPATPLADENMGSSDLRGQQALIKGSRVWVAVIPRFPNAQFDVLDPHKFEQQLFDAVRPIGQALPAQRLHLL